VKQEQGRAEHRGRRRNGPEAADLDARDNGPHCRARRGGDQRLELVRELNRARVTGREVRIVVAAIGNAGAARTHTGGLRMGLPGHAAYTAGEDKDAKRAERFPGQPAHSDRGSMAGDATEAIAGCQEMTRGRNDAGLLARLSSWPRSIDARAHPITRGPGTTEAIGRSG